MQSAPSEHNPGQGYKPHQRRAGQSKPRLQGHQNSHASASSLPEPQLKQPAWLLPSELRRAFDLLQFKLFPSASPSSLLIRTSSLYSHTKLYDFFFPPFSTRLPHPPFFLNTDTLDPGLTGLVFWLNSWTSVSRLVLATVCHSFCLPEFLIPSILLHIFVLLEDPICATLAHAPPQFAYLSTNLWISTIFYMSQNTGF